MRKMWLNIIVSHYPTELIELFINNVIIKLHVLSIFLLILTIYLFVIQKVLLARFFDIKIEDYLLRNDAYMTSLLLLTLVLTATTVLGYGKIESTLFELPLDFSPIIGVNVRLSLLLDNNSVRFLTVTTFIGYMVNTMVPIYMVGEVCIRRFWNLLNAFLFSMALLICSGNYLTMVLFWELIGFFSYFLINFWKKKASTLKSSMKAFVYNSVSDLCLLTFVSIYFKTYSTFSFPTETTVIYIDPNLNQSSYPAYLASLCVSASCKSAQFMFHFWLPDSMDAPAPASALIHSATLVAAGVFLLIRSKYLLMSSPSIKSIFIYVSVLTICVGGLSATYQSDLKKILAYSTISNCGFMVYITLVNSNVNAFMFFMTHGLFKASSFVLVGFLIVKMLHKQDGRFSGNIITTDGFISTGLLVTLSSLGGLPLTIMHYTKHTAITTTFNNNSFEQIIDLGITMGILSSAAYSIKIITTVMLGNYNKSKFGVKKESRDSFYTKLTLTSSIVFIVYLTTFLFLFFFKNKELSEFINTETFNSIYMGDSGLDGVITNEIFSYKKVYNFASNKLQPCIIMCYMGGLALVSLPTWLPTSQRNITTTALLIPTMFLTALLL